MFSKVGKRAQTEILSQLSKLGFKASVFKSRKNIANWNFTQVSDMLSSSDPITTYLSQREHTFLQSQSRILTWLNQITLCYICLSLSKGKKSLFSRELIFGTKVVVTCKMKRFFFLATICQFRHFAFIFMINMSIKNPSNALHIYPICLLDVTYPKYPTSCHLIQVPSLVWLLTQGGLDCYVVQSPVFSLQRWIFQKN